MGRVSWIARAGLVAASGCLAACAGHGASRSARENPLGLPDHYRSVESLTAHGMVTVLLGMWHDAAAHGDFNAYFSKMTDDAVFLGTDPGERWTREEFESFAKPYFDGVEAWTYEPIDREVIVGPGDDPEIAWFDEVLWNEKYGRCRGTGVARRDEDGVWRIAHYSLAFLVPNDKAGAVMEAIGPQPRPAAD